MHRTRCVTNRTHRRSRRGRTCQPLLTSTTSARPLYTHYYASTTLFDSALPALPFILFPTERTAVVIRAEIQNRRRLFPPCRILRILSFIIISRICLIYMYISIFRIFITPIHFAFFRLLIKVIFILICY